MDLSERLQMLEAQPGDLLVFKMADSGMDPTSFAAMRREIDARGLHMIVLMDDENIEVLPIKRGDYVRLMCSDRRQDIEIEGLANGLARLGLNAVMMPEEFSLEIIKAPE